MLLAEVKFDCYLSYWFKIYIWVKRNSLFCEVVAIVYDSINGEKDYIEVEKVKKMVATFV